MKRIYLRNMLALIFVSVGIGGCSHHKTTTAFPENELVSDTETALTFRDMELFDSLYGAWAQEYKCIETGKRQDVTQLKQYQQLRDMGKKIIPLIINKLSDKTQVFALPLYDELQDVDSLKSFDFSKGDLIRTQETVRKYIESKIGRKKYIFSSNNEKIDSIRELFRRYNWSEDTTLTKEKRDSILLDMDYEITEDFLKIGRQ